MTQNESELIQYMYHVYLPGIFGNAVALTLARLV